MANKRVIIFSSNYLPYVGGAEIAIKEITDRITGEYVFELIAPRNSNSLPSTEKIGNVLVHRVGFGSKGDKYILPIVGLIKLLFLKPQRGDIFWCMMASYASGVAYMYNKLFFKHIPIVLTLQEGDSEEHIDKREHGWASALWRIPMYPLIWSMKRKSGIKENMGIVQISWRLALSKTNYLTVISNYLKERSRHYGYVGPVEVIPNGVNVSGFSIKPKEIREKIRADLGFSESDTVLITTSRLNVKNGISFVIEAMNQLPSDVKFLVLGTGELEGQLKEQALKLGARVRFLGLVSHEEIPNYLSASDIFIRPSLSEGLGNSFIEAMAAGLPVIATPVGGIPDFLFDPSENPGMPPTGLFVKPEDAESIVDAVNKLTNDEELRNTLIRNGIELVRRQYDWNLVAKRMKEEIFDKV
jgi:glycosyltransferase involved in cell wall biosynthesis